MLYHGVRGTAAGCLYRLGVALLALDQPDRCLVRGHSWIFAPEAPYEREGDVGYVTFPCGYMLGADGDAINLYYGAGHLCGAREGKRAPHPSLARGAPQRVARQCGSHSDASCCTDAKT